MCSALRCSLAVRVSHSFCGRLTAAHSLRHTICGTVTARPRAVPARRCLPPPPAPPARKKQLAPYRPASLSADHQRRAPTVHSHFHRRPLARRPLTARRSQHPERVLHHWAPSKAAAREAGPSLPAATFRPWWAALSHQRQTAAGAEWAPNYRRPIGGCCLQTCACSWAALWPALWPALRSTQHAAAPLTGRTPK